MATITLPKLKGFEFVKGAEQLPPTAKVSYSTRNSEGVSTFREVLVEGITEYDAEALLAANWKYIKKKGTPDNDTEVAPTVTPVSDKK